MELVKKVVMNATVKAFVAQSTSLKHNRAGASLSNFIDEELHASRARLRMPLHYSTPYNPSRAWRWRKGSWRRPSHYESSDAPPSYRADSSRLITTEHAGCLRGSGQFRTDQRTAQRAGSNEHEHLSRPLRRFSSAHSAARVVVSC